ELLRPIEEREARIARFDARLLSELASEKNALALLQTLPGVDVEQISVQRNASRWIKALTRFGFIPATA
ncbi:MAG: hypothetical protein V5B39_19900, partial [Accumulibacter sp.]